MRLAGQAKGGFYPTPERVVDMIAQLIRVPTTYSHYRSMDVLRILDPCCGAGEALARFAEGLRHDNGVSIQTYGVELHTERAEEAAGRLDHTLSADLFQTSIANHAFGLCLLNPPYDSASDDKKRVEHAFLTTCTRYLDEGGLLVFIVPRHRLGVSAKYLASYYYKLQCWAFPQPEREDFDQVAVFGYRQAEPRPDEEAERRVWEWSEGEPETLEPQAYPVYTPSTTRAGDILFATCSVDPVAAAAEARRSGLWASPEITDSLWPTNDQRTRPLMPLRRGHMAMLIAAGFLDNLSLEADGQRILVKGKTTKEQVLVEDTPDKEVFRERLRTTVVALDLHDGGITDIAA